MQCVDSTATQPTIRKVSRVHGKSIVLADAQVEDAEFILSLRLDPNKAKFLSPVDADVEKQRQWIRDYAASEGQAFFVICNKAMRRLGTVRIYAASNDSFSWGSWILKDGAPKAAAIESALLVYQLAKGWGFRSAYFKVHRDNTSVLAFHERFGAVRSGQTNEEIHLQIGAAEIERSLERYARYLPGELLIE
jgi:Acetyltransferase (GNAT) domain